MRVPLFFVQIPSKTSRMLTVPAYDIPIIRALWAGDHLMQGKHIEVTELHTTEFRSLDEETKRIQRDYGVSADADPSKPAWAHVYGSAAAFKLAWQTEAEKGEAMEEKREREAAKVAAAAEKKTEVDPRSNPVAPKGRQPRKTKAKTVKSPAAVQPQTA